MRSFRVVLVSILCAVVFGSSAVRDLEAAAERPAANTVCPVMQGTRVNKKFYVDYEGQRILLCCRACVKAFKKNPKKYLNRLQ